MNSEKMIVTVIGGDVRQQYLIGELIKDGHDVKVYGQLKAKWNEGAEFFDTLNPKLFDSNIIIGPIPFTNDQKTIVANNIQQPIHIEEVMNFMRAEQVLIAGKIPEIVNNMAQEKGFRVVDLMERDDFAILNAIPTAEGAIQVAMEQSDIILHGSQALVLGFGRCAKVLADKLKGIGAKVTIAARKESDLAYAQSFGYRAINIKQLGEKVKEYDFIFNSIPTMIINEEILEKMNQDTIIIDIASKPGGVDFPKAEELGIKAVLALGLPGKVAPKTAGRYIKEVVYLVK